MPQDDAYTLLNEPFSLIGYKKLISGLVDHEFYDHSKDIKYKSDTIQKVENIGSFQNERFHNILVIKHRSSISARVKLTTETFKIMAINNIDAALVAYYSESSKLWRFSLVTLVFEESSVGRISKKFSNPKRYSFVLGPSAKIVTPYKYLISKGVTSNFSDLTSRFSIEVVNNEFYREIAKLYDQLVGSEQQQGTLRYPEEGELKYQFAVRLIGRIVFCWFLREKHSSNGIPLISKSILSREALNESDYYNTTLAPLFFETLNIPVNKRHDRFKANDFSNVPYLNGGLFASQEDDFYKFDEQHSIAKSDEVCVPNSWLEKLFDLLELYHFTVDENTSVDMDLSIDPEMLGRIFENLLARINPETGETVRKSTGSFYTPREIVEYMVDNTLIEYLYTSTGINRTQLDALVSYSLEDDLEYPLDEAQKIDAVRALSNIRILDPACGSGAYPIGAMQKIVFILQQIDPEAKIWFESQIANTIPEVRQLIEKEFENKNFDYIRKLGVIRESIFGADIQPIATEIARLRCFLTLIVDERVNDNEQNRGVYPLPNLDFKFVTANTLIKLNSSPDGNFAQSSLFEDQSGINELKSLREDYFNSHNAEKDVLKSKFYQAQKNMFLRIFNSNSKDLADTTRKLSAWDPFMNLQTDWFDPEWMFGVNDGFDIVIGNPPYVSAVKSVKENEINRDTYRETYKELTGAFDLYVAFLIRGKELLAHNGIYSWIIPNKFTVASYAKKTYDLLKNSGLTRLVTVSNANVFEASVYPIIILGRNDNVPADFDEYSAESLSALTSNLIKNSNSITDNDTYTYIKSTNLKIASGTTGFQAQLIKKYIFNEQEDGRIPFKVSGSIDPYRILNKPVRYMGTTYDHAFIEYGDDIAKSKWDFWSKDKIIIAGMTKRIEAVYAQDPVALGVGCYAIYEFGEYDKYALLGILNSKFISYYLRTKFKAKHLAGGYLAINKDTIAMLPIPDAKENIDLLIRVSELAKSVSDSIETSYNEDVESMLNSIDRLVYQLYKLDDEEISMVDSSSI